jgi:hypothetical protein
MNQDDDDDDNSDEDIGKAARGGSGLNYDSDDRDEESGAQNELIDLGSGGTSGGARSASHIKPLKAPGGR